MRTARVKLANVDILDRLERLLGRRDCLGKALPLVLLDLRGIVVRWRRRRREVERRHAAAARPPSRSGACRTWSPAGPSSSTAERAATSAPTAGRRGSRGSGSVCGSASRASRRAHASLMEAHARVSGVYKEYDAAYFDYDKDGEGCTQYHPSGLTEIKELLPLSSFGADDDYLQNAQRRYSSAIHHRSWLKHKLTLQGCSRREAVRFIAVSQPHAGSFLNAVPSRHGFRYWSIIGAHREWLYFHPPRSDCNGHVLLPSAASSSPRDRRSPGYTACRPSSWTRPGTCPPRTASSPPLLPPNLVRAAPHA